MQNILTRQQKVGRRIWKHISNRKVPNLQDLNVPSIFSSCSCRSAWPIFSSCLVLKNETVRPNGYINKWPLYSGPCPLLLPLWKAADTRARQGIPRVCVSVSRGQVSYRSDLSGDCYNNASTHGAFSAHTAQKLQLFKCKYSQKSAWFAGRRGSRLFKHRSS